MSSSSIPETVGELKKALTGELEITRLYGWTGDPMTTIDPRAFLHAIDNIEDDDLFLNPPREGSGLEELMLNITRRTADLVPHYAELLNSVGLADEMIDGGN